ncbi:hypothetical protein [Sorangium sp. So ce1099]|uniref:hypothetical protein n=1 Tax=Sorangium sp. So ce1099 TaxID=3133331 RepID=UPI003F612C23
MPTPYRDDADALEARHAQLIEELAAIKERVGELSALQQTQQRLERELSTVRQRLDGITARRVPLLDSLRVASPCNASWDEMAGDDRVRFCQHCEKNVYNLSEMPRGEAERLVRAAAGDLCVRLYQRADGTVLTADCPVGVNRRRIRNLTAAAVGGGLLAAGMALASASSSSRVVMGDRAEPPPRAVEPDGVVAMGGLLPRPSPPQPGASERIVMSIANRPAFPHAPAPAAPAVEEPPPGLEVAPAEPAATAPKAEPPRRGVAPGVKAPCGCAAGDPLCTCL